MGMCDGNTLPTGCARRVGRISGQEPVVRASRCECPSGCPGASHAVFVLHTKFKIDFFTFRSAGPLSKAADYPRSCRVNHDYQ
jgi:hypothetical protein